MAILGLILFAAAVAAGVEVALGNQATIGGEAFGYTVSNGSPAAFMFLGALLALVAVVGLMMTMGSFRRTRARRQSAKHRVSDVVDTNEALLEENQRLRDELVTERLQRETLGGVAVPPGVGEVPYGDQVSDAVRSETISDTGRYEPYPAEPRTIHPTRLDVDAVETEDTRRR